MPAALVLLVRVVGCVDGSFRAAQSCCWFCVGGGVPVVALMVRSAVVLRVDHVVALMVHYALLNLSVGYACLCCWLVLFC